MTNDRDSPTNREIGLSTDEELGYESTKSPGVTTIPWIDSHQHTQTLTLNDRERFDLTGCQAAVMIAAGYYWTPYRPVTAEDVRFLWDDALRRGRSFSRAHFYDQYIATGIHTWSRVDDWEDLIEVLPEYVAQEEVVAIGETGIESTQHTLQWDLDDQRAVLAAQMEVARDEDVPVIVHTPGSNKGNLPEWKLDDYEENNANFTESVLDAENAKREAVEIDIEIANEVGLDDEQVLIDHADETIVEYVMDETDCYLGFTVSAPWLRNTGSEEIAETIEEYGPERVIIDTDLAGSMKNDPFCMKRTMFDLSRLGVSESDLRTVVYENPKQLYGIDG